MGVLPNACQDGVIRAERQAGNLPFDVDCLGVSEREEIWVSFEHMDLELSVRMRRDSNAVVKHASV